MKRLMVVLVAASAFSCGKSVCVDGSCLADANSGSGGGTAMGDAGNGMTGGGGGADSGTDAGAVEADAGVDGGASSADAGPSSDGGVPLCLQRCPTGNECLPSTVCRDQLCVLAPVQTPMCTVANDCVAWRSGWDQAASCVTDATCAHAAATGLPLEACISVNGTGRCVRMPQSASDCANRRTKDLPWQDIEGHAVTVCGRDSAQCVSGSCTAGCNVDGDCSGSKPKCDVASHRCVCTANSCGTANAGRVCLPEGVCGCGTTADCNGPGFDQCFGKACGCSGDATCKTLVPDYDVVCR